MSSDYYMSKNIKIISLQYFLDSHGYTGLLWPEFWTLIHSKIGPLCQSILN